MDGDVPSAFDFLQRGVTPAMRKQYPVAMELRSDLAHLLEDYPDGAGDTPIVEALCRAVFNLEAEIVHLRAYTLGLERRLGEAVDVVPALPGDHL